MSKKESLAPRQVKDDHSDRLSGEAGSAKDSLIGLLGPNTFVRGVTQEWDIKQGEALNLYNAWLPTVSLDIPTRDEDKEILSDQVQQKSFPSPEEIAIRNETLEKTAEIVEKAVGRENARIFFLSLDLDGLGTRTLEQIKEALGLDITPAAISARLKTIKKKLMKKPFSEQLRNCLASF